MKNPEWGECADVWCPMCLLYVSPRRVAQDSLQEGILFGCGWEDEEVWKKRSRCDPLCRTPLLLALKCCDCVFPWQHRLPGHPSVCHSSIDPPSLHHHPSLTMSNSQFSLDALPCTHLKAIQSEPEWVPV